jgi:hypothetical protein
LALALYDFDLSERSTFPRRFGFIEIFRQEFHVQTDRGERILDFVGQSTGQPGDFSILIDQFLPDGVGR